MISRSHYNPQFTGSDKLGSLLQTLVSPDSGGLEGSHGEDGLDSSEGLDQGPGNGNSGAETCSVHRARAFLGRCGEMKGVGIGNLNTLHFPILSKNISKHKKRYT